MKQPWKNNNIFITDIKSLRAHNKQRFIFKNFDYELKLLHSSNIIHEYREIKVTLQNESIRQQYG